MTQLDYGRPRGYKGHDVGSRMEQVHLAYDEQGPDEAMQRGLELGLKPTTIRGWFLMWRRQARRENPRQ